MSGTSKFLIYGLEDPRTHELRYIGRSSNGLRRPRDHSKPSYLKIDGNTHKANWVRSLLRAGLVPGIRVLRECSSNEETCTAECELIAFYRAKGARLTNQSAGGEGAFGVLRSKKTKRKMSRAKKVWWAENYEEQIARLQEAGKKRQGKNYNPEHIAALGSAWKGKKRSAETIAKMSAAKKAWWAENREKQTAVLQEAGKRRRGKVTLSNETRQKMSEAKKGIPKSAETKARMSEGKRLGWARKKAAQAAEAAKAG